MSNNIQDLLNQLPKEVSVEQHYSDEQQKLIHNRRFDKIDPIMIKVPETPNEYARAMVNTVS